jgi:hypothetical protein
MTESEIMRREIMIRGMMVEEIMRKEMTVEGIMRRRMIREIGSIVRREAGVGINMIGIEMIGRENINT